MHIDAVERRDRNLLGAWALAVADAVRRATEQSTGLAGGAPAALVAIVTDPGLSIEELRRVLALTHPGTVRLVDRLAQQGWVRREHGTGRTLRLEPTPAGSAAERRLAAAREDAITGVLAALPETDVHTLAGLVQNTLTDTARSVESIRRLCRLCDHNLCKPCPVEHNPDRNRNDASPSATPTPS